ncbi:MAG: NADH-quinone oxidoreductase subunit NuoF [Actinomycetota bacterium]|nr:NADH-quinone oxidoreductase subunit NuoF [Actinomycetota bacterium]
MTPRIIVGLGSCGLAAGAKDVLAAIEAELAAKGVEAAVEQTGCIGLCYREVLVDVVTEAGKVTYGDVTPKAVTRIIQEHLIEGKPVEEMIVLSEERGSEAAFLAKQYRIVLRNCGLIDPENIDDYIAAGGYQSIEKVLKTMTPEAVIGEVKTSGLRGRGGAGFPTGLKWELTNKAAGDRKYIICNADEGDPGAFMDRGVLESDPHSVLEGMLIAGYAIGADESYIYCRAEYPLAIKRLNIAIKAAKERGYLGANIMGSGFNFNIKIKEGAGAFVCGEETALMASIEGQRGMPRLKPPFPATSGLWAKPTCINNVETFANISWILKNGGATYAAMGTEGSKGTKVFALTGKISRSGLAEVPMGMSLKEVIFEVGGGIKGDGEFKGVQIGGPTGGCLPAEVINTEVDYDSLTKIGATMGSGGMVVLDQSDCMVDLARFFLAFAQNESCGKCVPCRVGTKRMLEILERITKGEATEDELVTLKALAQDIKSASLCGLGQTAPNPVLSTLRYFQDEYLAHIRDGHCAAGVCAALTKVEISQKFCRQCAVCIRHCPSQAISGARHETTVIDQTKCTQCRICVATCPWDAIFVVSPRTAELVEPEREAVKEK